MEKRGFIRCIYGIYDNSHRLLARRQKIDADIANIKINKFNEPFKVYIFGKDNFDRMTNLGFDCVLVNENPAPFDLIKHQYRNKMELIKCALENDFESVAYLDWDCVPIKKLSDNFWEINEKRGLFQACLQQYHRVKCPWRSIDSRKVGNGGCTYFKNKDVIYNSIKCWESVGMPDNDEIGYAKYMDELMGEWKGDDYFWENFENMFCNLHKSSPHSAEKLRSKDYCFIHYQG